MKSRRRLESDQAEGVGPRGLQADLRVRLALASVLGVVAGLAIAALLTRRAWRAYAPRVLSRTPGRRW